MLSYLLDTSGENVMPIPTPEKPKLKPIDVEIPTLVTACA